MKVSVLLCFLILLTIHIDVSVSRAINCGNKRWHGSLRCQQVEELRQMRREMQNNEKGLIWHFKFISNKSQFRPKSPFCTFPILKPFVIIRMRWRLAISHWGRFSFKSQYGKCYEIYYIITNLGHALIDSLPEKTNLFIQF